MKRTTDGFGRIEVPITPNMKSHWEGPAEQDDSLWWQTLSLSVDQLSPWASVEYCYKWRYLEGQGGLCWILLQGRHVLVWASYDLYWSAQALSKVGMSTFWQPGFVRRWQKMCYLRSISRIVANINLIDYRNVLRNAYWSRSTINNGITY